MCCSASSSKDAQAQGRPFFGSVLAPPLALAAGCGRAESSPEAVSGTAGGCRAGAFSAMISDTDSATAARGREDPDAVGLLAFEPVSERRRFSALAGSSKACFLAAVP